VLFGVEGLQVTDAQALPDGTLEVWAVTGDPAAAACPDCGTVSARRHDTVLARPRDVRRDGDPVDTRRSPAHRYSPAASWHSLACTAGLLAPFAMCAPLACPDYYGASAPSRAFGRRRAYPSRPDGSRAAGPTRDGSRVHLRIDRSAWHPALPRQHRHGYAAGIHRGLPTDTPSRLRSRPSAPDSRALQPGPYPSDLSRCHAYGALPLVPLVYRLISLAGPGLSGSTKPFRLCQRCFPPSPASPGSDCAQLPLNCCDSPARRSCTSFDS
jgi:hypothetical protein